MDDPRFRSVAAARIEGIAPAKLNLFLEVLRRRDDGYHEIATLFHEVDLADDLAVELRPGARDDSLALRGRPLDVGAADNLALRAVRAYRAAVPATPPVHVDLYKRVPPGSGLGGGSSDAAFVLRALARLVEPLPDARLAALARELGADVGFFLRGGSAIGRGRGDELEPLHDVGPFQFLVALPRFGIATARAYAHVDLNGPRGDVSSFAEGLTRETGSRAVIAGCFNRLESAACIVEPALRSTLRRLREITERDWVMTGSGSALFLPMGSAEAAAQLAAAIAARQVVDLEIVRSYEPQPGTANDRTCA